MSKGKDVSIKVLIVDDNEVNTIILSNMLELYGIHAHHAYSGKNAIKLARKDDYDLIFIDHIMPDMDGVQTVEKVRSMAKDPNKSIIFALTSFVSEEIKSIYRKVGANEVYTKPLDLFELGTILKEWLPSLPIKAIPNSEDKSTYLTEVEIIKSILKGIKGINYEIGLKYAIGDPIHYIHILEVVSKDIHTCINRITKYKTADSLEEVRIGVHNLKSIFLQIGAIGLSEEAKYMESIIKQGELGEKNLILNLYLKQVENFNYKLIHSLNKHKKNIPSIVDKQEKVYLPMTEKEYEQSISNTIYYIKRFEYDNIINEIEKLIHTGRPEHKIEFLELLDEIKGFDYDKALSRIIRIKK